MHDRGTRYRRFEWLCACLILAPCAALAQQGGVAQRTSSASEHDAATGASAPSSARGPGQAARASRSASPGDAPSAVPPSRAPAKPGDDLEPAVDTSADTARTGTARERSPKEAPRGRASGKAMDHLELGTTDITGNRELPKVMYIVPWKRSDLGDLTGKPLNSLVDQTLEPVDRNVFERANRYYGAVTTGSEKVGTSTPGAPAPGAAQDVHRTPGSGSGSAARDER